MIEPRPGLYLGNPSARIRDILWNKAVKKIRDGGVTQIWSDTRSPQGYLYRSCGKPARPMIDVDGLALVLSPYKIERTDETLINQKNKESSQYD
ncbi:MAG TPA: type I-E CRISPR-associated endoribonuclease Cas2e [bacterium]|nr:type I-E CRISPR-associated endoribonuclease Cas2e [bacterium]